MTIKADLANCVTDITSWAELEARMASLPSEQERGEVFEQFCKAFFLLDPVFQFKEVYRQNEISPSIRQHLGNPGVQDLGIDGIGITHEGKIFAYQAKFRSDRKTTPTLKELSTFFTMSDKADWRITIANSNKLPSPIDDRVRHSRVLADRFDNLEPDFFDRLTTYLETQHAAPPAKKKPHITQQEAIERALSYYKENKRGQLILPCGAGKTLASIWISEELGGKNILVMLPSLSLLSQTLREWATNASLPFRYLCVCSDTTVDLGNDAPIENIYDMDVPVTTKYEAIKDFLNDKTSRTSIVFSTYQSSKVLSEAVLKSGTTFDIGIFDEAHRTAGTKIGPWAMALDDKSIPINYRIFMTATPKIYAPHITKKAKEEDVLICSMDDAEMYGHPFYEIGFAEAVKRGHITDYKVIVICVTDAEVKKLIEKGGRVITDQDHEWDAKALAKRVALVKGIRAYGLRKVFTFHGKVNSAKSFTDTSKPYGLHHIFKLIEPEKETQKTEGFFHVNGTMPSGTRSNILKEFESVDIGVMSNARCLVEGVNIPAVDTVAFIDPKRSLIDIVQATGRAMRKADWKQNGYIFIPVILEQDSDPEQIIKNSDFDTVWEVLQAMLDQDQRMEGIVSRMRILQGKGEEGTQAWENAMTEYAEKIEFYDLPIKIDKNRFIERLNTRIVEIIGRNWDFWYGLTLRYKDEFGDVNAPQPYKTPEGYKLSSWQSYQRDNYRKGKLSPDRIKLLENIGFTWEMLEEQFEKNFQEILLYKESMGTPNAPYHYTTAEGFDLGIWQNSLRDRYKKRKLSPDRIERLEEIGFSWGIFDTTFEKGVEETLIYKERTGNPNAPLRYKTSEDYRLGSWQSHQRDNYRKGKLSPDRIKRFENIGFSWALGTINQPRLGWDQWYDLTMKYKNDFGDANAPKSYKTPEGYRLGLWQLRQRSDYRKRQLSPDRIKRLEEIGFTWELLEDKFEEGLRETLKYKERTGNPGVLTSYKTPEGYKLSSWQSNQRTLYRKGKLSSDRIKRLEEIGFTWELLEEQFEKGFQETLLYKQSAGNPNAPKSYKTPEGYRLGRWQSHQRDNYRKGKLSPERIKQLEEIGFTWELLENKFEEGFQERLNYKESTGNPNALSSYRTTGGYRLGRWQSHQRDNYKKGKLNLAQIGRLEETGFLWEPLEDKFEKGFKETLIYKEKTDNPNTPNNYKTPEGYKLSSWQSNQRTLYRKGKLSSDRIERLEEIGFTWALLEEQFKKGFQETLIYKKRTGNPNAPNHYKTAEGFLLGRWQSHQRDNYRKRRLSSDRIKRLEEIGFTWELLEEQFEKGFQETLIYKKRTGNPNAPNHYKTAEGFLLGSWQNDQRNRYKNGKLSPDRIERLEEIGFSWGILAERFEKGFLETLLYKKNTGDPNTPWNYNTVECFRLYRWQYEQRQKYRKGKLSPERIKRLEDIGFKWRIKK